MVYDLSGKSSQNEVFICLFNKLAPNIKSLFFFEVDTHMIRNTGIGLLIISYFLISE